MSSFGNFVQEWKQQRDANGQISAQGAMQRQFEHDFCQKTVTDQQVEEYIHHLEKILPALMMSVPGKDNAFRQEVKKFLSSPVQVRQEKVMERELNWAAQHRLGRSMTDRERSILRADLF